MIKKIIIIFFLIFSISNNAFSKSPPLGTGSLVPSNIMIMLDNSGSMGWNLAGNELSSSSAGMILFGKLRQIVMGMYMFFKQETHVSILEADARVIECMCLAQMEP